MTLIETSFILEVFLASEIFSFEGLGCYTVFSAKRQMRRVYTAESQGERSGAVYRTFAPRGG